MPVLTDERPLETLDDAALIGSYVGRNDRDALEALFRRHADAAYATALRICRNPADARDAVQNAFIHVMQNAAAYRGGTEAAAKVWMMTIVVGTCKNRIRSEVRRRKWEELASGEQETICRPEDPSATEESKALAAAIFRELNGLPEHYRMPILLHYGQGMSLKETAVALSVSENTLHTQLKRGLERLREALAAQGVSASLASISAMLPLLPADVAPTSLLASLTDIAHGVGDFATAAAPRAAVPSAAKWAIAAAALIGACILGVTMLPEKQSRPPAAAKPMNYHWDFASPDLPKEFRILRGSVQHLPTEGEDKKGALLASNALIRIDIPITNFPVLVSYKATGFLPYSIKGCYIASKWLPCKQAGVLVGASESVTERIAADGKRGEWHTYNDYYTSTYSSRWKEDLFHDIYFQSIEADSRVTLQLEPVVLLDDLTIRAVTTNEVPDASTYLRAIEKIPPEKRRGEVPVPGLKLGSSPRNNDNVKFVLMRFFTNCNEYGEGTLEE